MTDPEPRAIHDTEELDAVLHEAVAVLYKHSSLCGTSARAARQVRAFMADRPGVPVYLVDVIRDQPLSREIARRLSVRHESPQALVLRAGEVVWSGSHGAVTAENLTLELEPGPGPTGGAGGVATEADQDRGGPG